MDFKEPILEMIAQMYSTTAAEVSKDISSMPIAEQQLDAFCEAMEEAGY